MRYKDMSNKPYSCETCAHNTKEWYELPCDACCAAHCGYVKREEGGRMKMDFAVMRKGSKMPRYIDADALKNEFPKDEDWDCPVNTNSFVCELIDKQPTADVRENVHGEWIDDYDPVNFGEFRYKCSKCGARTVEWADNFCYHCGADMRGERNENN